MSCHISKNYVIFLENEYGNDTLTKKNFIKEPLSNYEQGCLRIAQASKSHRVHFVALSPLSHIQAPNHKKIIKKKGEKGNRFFNLK